MLVSLTTTVCGINQHVFIDARAIDAVSVSITTEYASSTEVSIVFQMHNVNHSVRIKFTDQVKAEQKYNDFFYLAKEITRRRIMGCSSTEEIVV